MRKGPAPPRLSDDQIGELLIQGVPPVELCGIFNVRIENVMRVRDERCLRPEPVEEDLATSVKRLARRCVAVTEETLDFASPDVRLRTASGIVARIFGALGGSGNEDVSLMRSAFERFVIDAEVVEEVDDADDEAPDAPG